MLNNNEAYPPYTTDSRTPYPNAKWIFAVGCNNRARGVAVDVDSYSTSTTAASSSFALSLSLNSLSNISFAHLLVVVSLGSVVSGRPLFLGGLKTSPACSYILFIRCTWLTEIWQSEATFALVTLARKRT
jgi:hypothetical protein